MQVITGPNMGGKSTYMRQVALIVLLASIGLLRAGRQLPTRAHRRDPHPHRRGRRRGQRAVDFHARNDRSRADPARRHAALAGADGRNRPRHLDLRRPGTGGRHRSLSAQQDPGFHLFATHYFELTEFPAQHHGAINVHVSAVESGADIVFLHHIEPGPASKSYGIAVAKLAGVPVRRGQSRPPCAHRAGDPADRVARAGRPVRAPPEAPAEQSAVLKALGTIDPDAFSRGKRWMRCISSKRFPPRRDPAQPRQWPSHPPTCQSPS
jgi:DNA mismatch repair protein MutS